MADEIAYDMARIGTNVEAYFVSMDIKTNTDYTIAYMLTTDSLYTMNITDLTKPTVIQEYPGQDFIQADFYQEKYLVVSSQSVGFRIYNVEDPRNVTLVSQIADHLSVNTFGLHESAAYLATTEAGIVAVNISDVERPVITVNPDMSQELFYAKVLEDPWLIGADLSGYVYIYERTNLREIVLNSTYSICDSIISLVVTANKAIGVVSCSDYTVKKLDFLDLPNVKVVESVQDTAVITDMSLSTSGENVYTAADTHIDEFELATFQKKLSFNTLGATVELFAFNDYILTVELGAFSILEIKTTDVEKHTESIHLIESSSLNLASDYYLSSYDELSSFIFVSNTLMVYNTSDLLDPVSVANYSLGEVVPVAAHLSNDGTYLIVISEANTVEFYTYMDSLSHVASLTFQDTVLKAELYEDDKFLTVAAGSVVYIIDIHDRSSPEIVAELDMSNRITTMAVCMDEYIVVTTSDGLDFLDIRNIPTISIANSFAEAKSATNILVFPDCETLLTTDTEGVIVMYRVERPTSLTMLTSKLVRHLLDMKLSVSEDYLTTIDSASNIKVFNVLPDVSSCVAVTSLLTAYDIHQLILYKKEYFAIRTQSRIHFFRSVIGEAVIPEVSATTVNDGKEFTIKFYPYSTETGSVSSSAKFLNADLMDSDLRTKSPEYWMTLDAAKHQLRLIPPSVNDLLDSYSIQVNFSLPVDSSEFEAVATESMTSSDIEVELIKLGYLNVDGYLTNNFDYYADLKLSREFSGIAEYLHSTLMYYKSSVIVTISTQELLDLNSRPVVSQPLASQLDSDLNIGQLLDFQFASTSFSDSDLDVLEYDATYQTSVNGVAEESEEIAPNWLTFDPETRRFYGSATIQWFLDDQEFQLEQTREKKVTVTVKASDGYESAKDSFDLVYVNNIPMVNSSLQNQFDEDFGVDGLAHGYSLSFSFLDSSFIDADNDELFYSAVIDRGGGWESLETAGYVFDTSSHNIEGTAENPHTINITITIKVTVRDRDDVVEAAEVSDQFSFVVLSAFPNPDSGKIEIQSNSDSETLKLLANPGYKLYFPESFDSATATDLGKETEAQIEWELEGTPEDINSLIGLGQIRTANARRLQDELPITLVIDDDSVSYPASVFREAPQIQLVADSRQEHAYIGQQFTFNLEDAVVNEDELILSYSIEKDQPSEAGNWLEFDEGALRLIGVPGESSDLGDYTITVTITDIFEGSEIFVLNIAVDYTDFDLFIKYLEIWGQVIGVVIGILGFLKYHQPIRNIVSVKSYRLHPLAYKVSSHNQLMYKIRLPILHPDETAMAKRIYKAIKEHLYIFPNNIELSEMMSRVLRSWRDDSTGHFRRSLTTDIGSSPLTSKSSGALGQVLMTDESLISINGEIYHPKYLFDNVRHRVNKLFLTKLEWSRMKRAFQHFKKYHESEFQQTYRDSWCRSLPVNVTETSRVPSPDSVDTLLDSLWNELGLSQTEQARKIFCDLILYKLWRSTAVWCDKNYIDNVVVSRQRASDYKQNNRCIQKLKLWMEAVLTFLRLTERPPKVWKNEKWIRVEVSDEELLIKVYPEFGRIDRLLVMTVYNTNGAALAEAQLVPPAFNKALGTAYYECQAAS